MFYSFNDYRVFYEKFLILSYRSVWQWISVIWCSDRYDSLEISASFRLIRLSSSNPDCLFPVCVLFLLLSPLHPRYMNKAHYHLRTLIFSRKLQSLLDVLDESIDDSDVTYFLFATFRCGICDSTDVGDTGARSSITFDIQCV